MTANIVPQMTLFFLFTGVIGSIGIFVVPAMKQDKGLSGLLVWTTVVCMWLLWLITYMMQLNPLIEPKPIGGED